MSLYSTLFELRIPIQIPAARASEFGLVDPDDGVWIPVNDDGLTVHAKSLDRAPRKSDLRLEDATCETWCRVTAQAVGAHIQETGEIWKWLPPPVPENAPYPRAVFFIADWTPKGTELNGQEYIKPLLVIHGPNWPSAPISYVCQLEDALEADIAEALTFPPGQWPRLTARS